jgi:hypothetical protein
MQRNTFIISVVDSVAEDRRDRTIKQIEAKARGSRCQPPMVDRLRVITVLVEHLEATGIPFATAPNSRMNKAVRQWINERMQASSDPRKVRRKPLSPDGVRALLRQVSKHR